MTRGWDWTSLPYFPTLIHTTLAPAQHAFGVSFSPIHISVGRCEGTTGFLHGDTCIVQGKFTRTNVSSFRSLYTCTRIYRYVHKCLWRDFDFGVVGCEGEVLREIGTLTSLVNSFNKISLNFKMKQLDNFSVPFQTKCWVSLDFETQEISEPMVDWFTLDANGPLFKSIRAAKAPSDLYAQRMTHPARTWPARAPVTGCGL